MAPHGPADSDTPTEPDLLAMVHLGMQVLDAAGAEVGRVGAVRMPGTGADADLPAPVADRLSRTGYVRVKSPGLLSQDIYVRGDQVAQVAEVAESDGGRVTLAVTRDVLIQVQ